MKLPNFFFDTRLSVYWKNAFFKILSKTRLVGLDLALRKNIQVWLTFDIAMLLQTKKLEPIDNGNVADSGMIAFIDMPLPCWKPKKEWNFKCKILNKKLISCCFSQIKPNRKLTRYLMYLCYFFSYLYKYLNPLFTEGEGAVCWNPSSFFFK